MIKLENLNERWCQTSLTKSRFMSKCVPRAWKLFFSGRKFNQKVKGRLSLFHLEVKLWVQNQALCKTGNGFYICTLERQTDRSPAQQHLLGRILQWTFALRWCSGTVKLRNLTLVKHVVSERPRRELFKAFGMTHVLHQSSVQKPQQLDSNLAFYKLSFLTDSYLCMLKYYNWTRQSRPRQSPSVEEEWAQTIQTIVGSVMTEWGRSGRLEIWSLYKNSLCWSEERRREDRKCRSKERVLGCVQDYNIKQTGRW